MQLNSFTYTKNTLIYADCIVLPDATSISVAPNVHLSVISLTKTSIGKGVVFSTKPSGRPPRASNGINKGQPMQHTEYTQAKLSGCHAGKTAPGESNYDLVGKAGTQGFANVDKLSFALSGVTILGVQLTNAGGDGGDAGASGHLRCWCTNDCSDQDHCHDGENSDGPPPPAEPPGGEGPAGYVSLATYGTQASPMLDTLVAATARTTGLQHKQAYAKAAERADFIRLEVKPLTDLADKDSWEKIPPPK